MSREPLRIAVAGCGWAARTLHAPAIRRTRCAEIVAVGDPREGSMRAFRGARRYTDWRAMLAETACEAVLVAAPPDVHADIAVAALERGLHVLVEKPLAATLADAQRVAAAARTAGRVAAVGFNLRCHPALARLRARVARGELGTLEAVRVTWHSGAGAGTREWLGARARGGGALLDLGSHVVDLWRFLAGDELATIRATSRPGAIDDECATLAATALGGATLTADLSLVDEDRFEIEVSGNLGRVRVRPYGRHFRRSYDAQWEAFAAAVRGAGPVAATLDDGLASLTWIQRAAEGLPQRADVPPPPIACPMTAVVATARGFAAVRTTVAHLRRQSVVERIELLLAGPGIGSVEIPADEVAGFAAVSRVDVAPGRSIGEVNATAVRRARGRIVALTEDHCFPDPGWAEALLAAHEGDASVVGPVVSNANPATRVSEADFVLGYGPWMEPMAAAAMPFLPGHNSSYKRDELLALGGRLERLLEAETVLHMAWSAEGRTLRVEPRARVRHVNFSRWRSFAPVQFLAGRAFGAARAATWPRRRRLLYAAASPLIPVVRLARVARAFRAPGRSARRLARMMPALAAGLLLDGAGQFMGYLFGAGDAVARLARYEFDRVDHVRHDERALWTSP